eukprot:6439539-Heterocapsa_arctica.AAC.1
MHAFGDDAQTKGGKQITLTARPGGVGANRREINAKINARYRGKEEVMRSVLTGWNYDPQEAGSHRGPGEEINARRESE